MQHKQTPLISPVIGTQRYLDSFHFGPAGQGKKAYIQASLHADELPGMLVVWKLKQQLKRLESQQLLVGEVVLVPVANPIGQNQHLMDVQLGRYELEHGQNFNRGYYDTFSTVSTAVENKLSDDLEANKHLIRQEINNALEQWPVKTELHSLQKTLQSLSCDADVVLDLHCDFEAMLHIYSTYYSWPAIEPLARLMDCNVNLLADDTGGEPFDSSLDRVWQRLHNQFGNQVPQGAIGATIELRGQGDVTDDYADTDSSAILQYLQTLGILSGNDVQLPKDQAPSSDLSSVETPTTSQGGLLVLKVQPGQWVEAGQVFAEVINPITDQIELIKVTQAGRVYSRTNRRTATAGMLVGNIAGNNAIRSGYLLAP
ncbi:succinylglutamate desuccinylase/aspartoacylase family protein [Vibrio sp. MA40-2]|uniref:succinylglutamate desuccinylase/aspartoacylase family protein n=1 Tax=Vibrio sp. MA40-2 TaxID=3391828 RepID=UPI0039A5BE02